VRGAQAAARGCRAPGEHAVRGTRSVRMHARARSPAGIMGGLLRQWLLVGAAHCGFAGPFHTRRSRLGARWSPLGTWSRPRMFIVRPSAMRGGIGGSRRSGGGTDARNPTERPLLARVLAVTAAPDNPAPDCVSFPPTPCAARSPCASHPTQRKPVVVWPSPPLPHGPVYWREVCFLTRDLLERRLSIVGKGHFILIDGAGQSRIPVRISTKFRSISTLLATNPPALV
jgi:hypothetical protein